LGTDYEDACGKDGKGGRAAILNALFDEWEAKKNGEPIDNRKLARYGTIDWLFSTTRPRRPIPRRSPSARSRLRGIMQMICDTLDKKGRRIAITWCVR